ncbi:formate dehydrogenase subunit gamma [Phenylobacterium sp.]|uniref:formate dehydrogenase subunit gamma n=1 Tax=Phenylobacterium sp. TaxID=1871053 RepID=UPI0027333934|nr:formate dehydrogenase subunit gamma [Phenylobacterium sp.]MDP3660153.1 formate dehydrogenase subunit gamma [Phenylobacterium sp.]
MSASLPQIPWNADHAAALVARCVALEGPLLPALHVIQATFGCVPDEAVPIIAQVLNLSRADVHGVLTFYHDFRRVPAGRRILKFCAAEACQARGSADAIAQVERALGLKVGETRSDGAVTLEAVYCLGLCASGPAALLDGDPFARLKGARLDHLLTQVLP